MKHLIAILKMEEGTNNGQIKVSIENEVDQIAALIKSAKEVPTIEFYNEDEAECLFASTKKGFKIYDSTWSIFAQDIAELIFKIKIKVRITNCWIAGEPTNLENAILKINEDKLPIDCSMWEEPWI